MYLQCFDYLPATRRAILMDLKHRGRATIPRIARDLSVTHEAVRRQLGELRRLGWVRGDCEEDASVPITTGAGRPAVTYCLTQQGDNLFHKDYDELALALFDASGGEGVDVLTAFTNVRVERLSMRRGRVSLAKRMESLRAVYMPDDPFTDVERDGEDYVLIERNCPYLNFALERPGICSTTVSTLRRLTGRIVVREDRFQDGDGRCTFRIITRRPASRHPPFEIEPPKPVR